MAIEDVIARLQEIRSEGLTALDAVRDAQALRDAEVRFLGRKGPLAAIVSDRKSVV